MRLLCLWWYQLPHWKCQKKAYYPDRFSFFSYIRICCYSFLGFLFLCLFLLVAVFCVISKNRLNGYTNKADKLLCLCQCCHEKVMWNVMCCACRKFPNLFKKKIERKKVKKKHFLMGYWIQIVFRASQNNKSYVCSTADPNEWSSEIRD